MMRNRIRILAAGTTICAAACAAEAETVPSGEITQALSGRGHTVFPIGKPNTAYEQYFTGQTWLAPMAGGEGIAAVNVTFAPGAINHWHGAAHDSWFQHLSIAKEGVETEWLEPVDPREYEKLKQNVARANRATP